ncbi:hypothetical protein [Xanthomonas phaseoli]|uniref:hypothetical protein n=1 Tax=Xanthomonas phaseoli TaxID=1985254 RepID=UPI0001CEC473|nr:hypothetical protein [Xanthomonas phaseoli]EFF45523.1 hypothetical protein XAUB_03680 [Xanthomonas citri pv. aurantifolii str. ICPB 11122]
MRDGHAKFLAARDLADNSIAFLRDRDQIFARRACVIDHLCDPLLGVGDRGPFGFDIAHGAQRFQLIGMGGAVLLVFGNSAAVLRVGFGLGQVIRGRCEHIAVDKGDFECVLQVVDLGGDALQCSSVIAYGGAAAWGFAEIVKMINNCIRI